MMENGAEGHEVVILMGGVEELFDGAENQFGGVAASLGFLLQQAQHFFRHIHNGNCPTALAHFQGEVTGSAAALEAGGCASK